MFANGCSRRGARRRVAGWIVGLVAAFLASSPAGAQVRNVTEREFKFGILAHDAKFLGGKEGGVDFNPEIILPSPVADSFAASLPWYFAWMAQPRFAVGGEINTSGYTSQMYFGGNWTWELASNVLSPGDGITVGIFFGPSFNNGKIVTNRPDRKSLGSNVLFREALELGYRVNPMIELSLFVDHVSNGGLAKQNQSINDFGGRIGIRF
jgi:hypothetical protein